jgi:sterol carrier protein 2
MTQIPIINVNNNCSTGSTALYQARNAVASGQVECAMALGFEKMARGSLSSTFSDRTNPLGKTNSPHFSHPNWLFTKKKFGEFMLIL